MIQANELRIGNWVQRFDGSVFQVTKFDIFQLHEIPLYLNPKPIPITEEWLLKLGFEERKNLIFTYSFPNKKYAYTIFGDNEDGFSITLLYKIEIKYVHQLQNLYFALTGEELTIKNEQP